MTSRMVPRNAKTAPINVTTAGGTADELGEFYGDQVIDFPPDRLAGLTHRPPLAW